MKRIIKISIIIAVYNNETYLPNALESVLTQDYQDFEIIIVDDGSTDRTGDIADEYARLDKRIKVIHQENQWIYASFNRGIREATGEYIYILNSDDKLRPNVLGVMYDKVQKYNPDVIWTMVLIHECDENQCITKYDRAYLSKRVKNEQIYLSKEEVRKAWPYFEESFLSHNQANLYKRKLALEHPFRNDVYGADTLFNIDIAPYVESAMILDIPVYDHFFYKNDSMNASNGKYYSYEHDMFNEIYSSYIKLFMDWDLPRETYEVFLAKLRLINFTLTIRHLLSKGCNFTTTEKIKKILFEYIDETILKCTAILNAEEELESRVLSGIREILVKEMLPEDSEMYFVYELLNSLLRYEKNEDDYQKIESAINHPLNPHGIGKIFYGKLRKD